MIQSILDFLTSAFAFLYSSFKGIFTILSQIGTFQTFLVGYLAVLPSWITAFISLGISISIVFLILGRN